MNKYEVVKTLGQGGYGKANLVCRRSDKKLFVVKEVRLTSLSQKDRDDAIQEAKLLASLRHPYIVEYEESFQDRGVLYIIMGYADGGDLSKKIESRGTKLFSEEEVLHDFIEIALAIKYIHDRKICHRDLKGQNIFLLKDGTVKLGDFGISRVLEHTFNYCRTQIGTPYYLSPEICQGRNYNFKTDIWSLGCILYELCALKHAFQSPNMKQLMMNIISTKHPPIPPNFSQDIRNLIDRMLMKEPEKRPNINQILKTPFIQKRLHMYLEKTMLDYEMGHTKLRDRKPFAPPTIIISKEKKDPSPKPSQHQARPAQRDGGDFDERQRRLEEQERQIRMQQLALKKKEAELAMKEKAMIEKKQREIQQQAIQRSKDDDKRAQMQYYEQKRKMLENKAKMQQEMSGNNMKYALRNQFDSDSYYYSDYDYDDHRPKVNKQQNKNFKASNYEQMARDDFFEKQRLARANRERMKLEELQGGQMQRALMMAQEDEDDKPRNKNVDNNKKNNNDDYAEINAVMRENRRQAAENKRRLEEAERGLAAKDAMNLAKQSKRMKTITKKKKSPQDDDYYYYSDYYSDYSDPPPKPKIKPKPSTPQEQPPQKQPQKAQNSEVELNEYMRQLRHERLANLERAKAAEKKAKEEEMNKDKKFKAPVVQKDDSDDYEPPPPKEKKVEMTEAERNAFMREERHQRRANKARIEAMGRVDMDQIIAMAEAQQRANPSLDVTDHDQVANQNDVDEDDEPPPQKEKKVELSQAERNAYMREERHQRRANKARIEAMGKINMDQLIAQAEAEQRANPRLDDTSPSENKGNAQITQEQDDEPPPQKEKKVELSQAERNAYMREERHQRRANKARIEAMGKINMDQLIAQAEAEQRANPTIDSTPTTEDKGNEPITQEQDDEPPPQKEKKVELSQAERNAYMREERHQRRANKARIEAMGKINMDQLIAQAEAEQRANPIQEEPPKPVEAPKPKEKEKPQEPVKAKKSPRLLGDDVTEAIRSGRFGSKNNNSTASDNTKMTVAEARRKQKGQQVANPPSEVSTRSKKLTGSQAPLLDKEQMKALFQQKRDNLRQNHEKIKASQDGSKDPNLMPASQSTSSHVSSSANALSSSRGRLLISSDSKKKMTNSSSLNKDPSTMKNSLKPDVATFAEDVRESKSEAKIDLSQALNMRSTGEFLKSRSLVLDQLQNEEDLNEDENNQDELDSIRERANVFNDALDINDDDLADSQEQINPEDDLNPGMKYFLENKGVKLPAISDNDSMSYRAEVIRAFLEEKIGLDKVVALRTVAMDQNGADELDKLFAGMDPGLIALAQQLFMMDDTMDCCAL